MYSPKFNQVADRGSLLEAMRAYSFAILFGPQSAADAPAPLVATHLPLVIRDEGPHGLLEGHFAKANRHWQSLAGRETLVVFPGPHSYVSPSLYTEELSVPTWNYIAIHAYGTLELVEDDPGKEALLSDLIAATEPAFATQWAAVPDGFRRTMLAGIKISQNRAPEERANVQAAQAAGDGDQQALAAWMQRLIP
jgi:transcriptional regulator